MDVPALVRAARRMRGISQRELAECAQVPASTVDRIESGRSDPRVGTLDRILSAIGVELTASVGGQPVRVDAKREQLIDFAGRHFPPHWQVEPVREYDRWWGWWRKHPKVRSFPPSHTYWRRWARDGVPDAAGLAYLWQDAT